ncbi:hypothetical protein WT88_29610 [Burkholderia stagnalis]|uniref:phage tail assembly protein n=1 Tax=Burkholderia TaxID=32008 RepID=UPI00075CFF4A|nr:MULTISPECIES: phage tail assembly protein [Burkholderia]KVZ18639.1 hypothetical protein WT35_04550 [Burkholderia stagnalis]KWN32862.1 hypothetical protein WT86_18675 [Burkholderia stagnalis]KWN44689.1 hypothetical protein WT88_29610 [Burkholderia stagnalis]KWN54422.1 hypothetical protein WT87_03705 [Burkholderia stagnalis]KWO68829.1 hypothetical protein WT99_21075 [Burkholderia stagnalis]
MEDQKILTLRKPVKIGDETFTTLTLREPTAGELERATVAERGLTVTINLISMVAGVPRQVVERITGRDLREAASFLEGFTEDGPTTGATQ